MIVQKYQGWSFILYFKEGKVERKELVEEVSTYYYTHTLIKSTLTMRKASIIVHQINLEIRRSWQMNFSSCSRIGCQILLTRNLAWIWAPANLTYILQSACSQISRRSFQKRRNIHHQVTVNCRRYMIAVTEEGHVYLAALSSRHDSQDSQARDRVIPRWTTVLHTWTIDLYIISLWHEHRASSIEIAEGLDIRVRAGRL